MSRREFITLLGGVAEQIMRRRQLIILLGASVAAWPVALHAQQKKATRIGVLLLGTRQSMATRLEALLGGLAELGYVEGKNISLEIRWAEGHYDRLNGLAAELIVGAGADVLVTHGTPGARATLAATSATPIVAISGDALATGLIGSLSHPGGNLTGLTFLSTDLIPKRLEIVKDALPNVRKAAVFLNAGNPISTPVFQAVGKAAAALAITLRRYDFRDAKDLGASFAAMSKDGIEAVVTYEDLLVVTHAKSIADHALKQKIALVGGSELVHAGGLISYAINVPDLFRRAAVFVDKILRGERPGNLPVELPTKFEFFINARTAKALGITIPPTLFARADAVIE